MDEDNLPRAVQEHARYVVGDDKPSGNLANDVQKAATMRPRGKSTQAQVDAMVLVSGKRFYLNPQAEALYRSTNVKYIPGLTQT